MLFEMYGALLILGKILIVGGLVFISLSVSFRFNDCFLV